MSHGRTPISARPGQLAAASALALAALTGCAGQETSRAGVGTGDGSLTVGTTSNRPSLSDEEATFEMMALEDRYDARLGVLAVDTGSGTTLAHRADERFAYASTYKALAAAAVLDRTTRRQIARVVRYEAPDLVTHSPVTEQHVRTGLTRLGVRVPGPVIGRMRPKSLSMNFLPLLEPMVAALTLDRRADRRSTRSTDCGSNGSLNRCR